MEPERRRVPRTTTSELSYVQFGEYIGGIVWNASEFGLGFHATAPVQKSGPIRLCISPNPNNRIELSGAIAWTDDSKRFGGLRFTEIAADTRELIRGWLAQSSLPENAIEEFRPPKLSTEDRSPLLADAPITTSPSPRCVPISFSPESPAQRPLLVSHPWRTKGLYAALLTCGVILATIVLSHNFRAEIGSALIRSGEKLQGSKDGPASLSPTSPARILSPASSINASQAQLSAKTSTPDTQEKSPSSTAGQNTPPVLDSPETRPSGHSTNLHSTNRRSDLAQQLWSEIGAGNVTAEVELAQLYLRGDGVSKNCEQARVLLRAASKKGNIQATRQLWNLKGCR